MALSKLQDWGSFVPSGGGVPQNKGYLFGDPCSKDCSILGSILGSPV